MRDPKRIDEVVRLVRDIWKRYPDMRFIQLLDSIKGSMVGGGYYYEDDKVAESLKDILKKGF